MLYTLEDFICTYYRVIGDKTSLLCSYVLVKCTCSALQKKLKKRIDRKKGLRRMKRKGGGSEPRGLFSKRASSG